MTILEPLAAFDGLADRFPTTEERLVVTVATAMVAVIVAVLVRRLRRWLSDRTRPLYGDVAVTVAFATTVVAAVSVSLGVWGRTGEIAEAAAALDLDADAVPQLIVTGVVVLSAYVLTRFVRRLLGELMESSAAVTEHQRRLTYRILQVILWTTGFVVVLGVWEVDLSGLLLGAGFLGIVVGMAARQTLGAMIAGFVLMFARPFEIGDWVDIDGNEGIVSDISIVNTRVRTVDGEYVMIPNDVVGSSVVTNRSRRGRLRLEIEVSVDYEADVERAADLAERASEEVSEAISTPSPRTVTKEFGDSAIVLGVRFWIDDPSARRRWSARTAAIGAIKDAFADAGIKIPYPQRELSGRAETGGFRVADDPSDPLEASNSREASGPRVEPSRANGSDARTESERGGRSDGATREDRRNEMAQEDPGDEVTHEGPRDEETHEDPADEPPRGADDPAVRGATREDD